MYLYYWSGSLYQNPQVRSSSVQGYYVNFILLQANPYPVYVYHEFDSYFTETPNTEKSL